MPGPSPTGPYAGSGSAIATDTMARWAERLAGTLRVPGSNPGGGENLRASFGLLYSGSTAVRDASRQPQYAILALLPRMRGPRCLLPQGGLGISCFFSQRGPKKQEIPKPRVPLACATGRQWALICPPFPPFVHGWAPVQPPCGAVAPSCLAGAARSAEQPPVSLFPVGVSPPRGSLKAWHLPPWSSALALFAVGAAAGPGSRQYPAPAVVVHAA